MNKQVWCVHTMDESLFLYHSVIAIGWNNMGDLSQLEANKKAFREKYQLIYPDASSGHILIGSNLLYRFVHEMQIGDYIVFPPRHSLYVWIGIVTGSYQYNAAAGEYAQQRPVKWLTEYARSAFSRGALAEIGSAMTFFPIKKSTDEFLSAISATQTAYPSLFQVPEIAENRKDRSINLSAAIIPAHLSASFSTDYTKSELIAGMFI